MEKTIRTKLVLLALIFILTMVPMVSATVVSPLSLTAGASESRDLSGLPVQNVSAQGGNITNVNIDVLSITKAWQGYYGNITGTITLDDASNKTFYNWSMTTVGGEVYSTRANNADFTTVDCTTSAELSGEETYLGQVASDGDSVSNTFNLNYGSAIQVGSSTTSANCNATRLYQNEAQAASDFWEVLLADGSSNIIYTSIIDDNTVGYDGGTYDFQMLVGENEHAGNEGTTPYYFFVELD